MPLVLRASPSVGSVLTTHELRTSDAADVEHRDWRGIGLEVLYAVVETLTALIVLLEALPSKEPC